MNALPGGPSPSSQPAAVQQPALVRALRPLAIAGMLACIGVSLSQLIVSVNPVWPGAILVWLLFVVSLESMHAYRLLEARGVGDRDRGRFRFVEWVVILLVVRLVFYLGKPAGSLVADAWAWSADLARFFDTGFILSSLLVACFWAAALVLARTLAELDAADYELHRASNELESYLWQTMPRHGRADRGALLRRVSAMFLGGGIVMIILAGMARVNVRELVTLQHGRVSGPILNVLLYFALGLLVISQAHFAALKAGWDLDRLPVWDQIGKRWVMAAIGFLLLVGVLALLLPVGYSVGLIATMGAVVEWIWYILVQVVVAILFVFGLIMGLFLYLFAGKPIDTSFELSPPPDLPAQAAAAGGSAAAWWPLVRSLLFWTALLAVVGYSLLAFARDRWGLFQGLSFLAWLQRLRGLFGRARGGIADLLERVQEGVLRWRARRAGASDQGRPRFLSLGRLSARERVRYFYLLTVRRAEKVGLARRPSQTPLEYEDVLAQAAPEEESVDTLTEAFVQAQYSLAEVTPDDAEQAKGAWQRVKRALQRRARGVGA